MDSLIFQKDQWQSKNTAPHVPSMDWVAWTQFAPSVLQKNLDVLHASNPEQYQKILPFFHDSTFLIRTNSDGFRESAQHTSEGITIKISADRLKSEWHRYQKSISLFSPRSSSSVIFHLGLDLGNTFPLLLNHLHQSPQKFLVFIEPDVTYFALTLAAIPMDIFFQSNRCIFAIGENWKNDLKKIFWKHNLFFLDRPDIYFCSTAKEQNRIVHWNPFKEWIENLIRVEREKFASLFQETVLHYQEKPRNDIHTILALNFTEKDGQAIPYIQQRFLKECKQEGFEIIYHKPCFCSELSYIKTIVEQKPDLLLFINKSPKEFANIHLLNQLNLPRMIWCLDDPNCFIHHSFSKQDYIFSWDMSYKENLLSFQAASVDFFPYVADLDSSQLSIQDQFISKVSFIGQVKEFHPEEYNLDDRTTRLIQHVGRLKAENPNTDYQDLVFKYQDEFNLHIIANPKDPIPPFIRYGIYVTANAQRRIYFLEAALPFGLKLYGNSDWLQILKNHPLRDCYQGPADPTTDVPSIFCSSTININIHSLQARTSLNQRDFNCPLANGFLLSDWVEGADTFFVPDIEMVFYHTRDDFSNKIHYYLSHQEERAVIIEKGKRRVLREHTYEARVPSVLNQLKSRIQERQNPRDK